MRYLDCDDPLVLLGFFIVVGSYDTVMIKISHQCNPLTVSYSPDDHDFTKVCQGSWQLACVVMLRDQKVIEKYSIETKPSALLVHLNHQLSSYFHPTLIPILLCFPCSHCVPPSFYHSPSPSSNLQWPIILSTPHIIGMWKGRTQSQKEHGNFTQTAPGSGLNPGVWPCEAATTAPVCHSRTTTRKLTNCKSFFFTRLIWKTWWAQREVYHIWKNSTHPPWSSEPPPPTTLIPYYPVSLSPHTTPTGFPFSPTAHCSTPLLFPSTTTPHSVLLFIFLAPQILETTAVCSPLIASQLLLLSTPFPPSPISPANKPLLAYIQLSLASSCPVWTHPPPPYTSLFRCRCRISTQKVDSSFSPTDAVQPAEFLQQPFIFVALQT